MDWRPGGTLRELVAYWADGFDFGRFETELAALPHLRATVGELGIHFLHVPGRGPNPAAAGPHPRVAQLLHGDAAGHPAPHRSGWPRRNDIARLIEYYRRREARLS